MKKKYTRAYKIYLAVGLVFVLIVLAGTYMLFSNLIAGLGGAM